MNFAYTDDQEALRELARKILADLATHERLCEIEAGDAGWDSALWLELGRANLLGACLPEAQGGMGLGIFELCILLEEAGRHVAPVPLWATLCLAALPIARFGNERQRADLLPGVIAGETVLTGAFEESDAVDPSLPSTRAERDGEGWRLFGRKICVPAAHAATRVLVPAETGSGPALFLLDPSAPNVGLERQRSTNREPLFTVALEGAAVADSDRLGAPDQGAAILQWTLERATTGLCALQLGVADRALQMTAEYAREREQFDRPIGSFQAVHQRAADAYIQIEGMRLTLLQAAHRLELEEPASLEVSVAKIWAAEGGNCATYAAQHLHGGIGMDNDYPLHRSYLWTRHLELLLGSAERHLEKLGASL
jgi:hypothetical protein